MSVCNTYDLIAKPLDPNDLLESLKETQAAAKCKPTSAEPCGNKHIAEPC